MRKCLKILLLILLSQVASGQEKPSEKFTKKYNAAKTDSEKGECIYSSIPEDSSLMTTLKNFLSFFCETK